MSRHDDRLKIIFALYQSLLLKKDLRLTIADSFENCDQDEFVNKIAQDLILNLENYKNNISKYLVGWTFDRLAYLEQAILVEASSELKLNINNKNIVIDEAINVAKKYCDESSYKFINGVLDKL